MKKKKKLPKMGPIERLKVQNIRLKNKLEEATSTLRAIQNGDVDALIVSGEQGQKIFTLSSVDQTYRTLVETMNEGAMTLSIDGIIFYCNKRFADALGRTVETTIGSLIFDYVSDSEMAKFMSDFNKGKRDRSSGTYLLKTLDETSVPLYISMSASQIDGKAGVCVIATDLTQQIRFKEYEVLAEELENAVKSRDEFISVASHELKTPLTSLLMQSQLQQRLISKDDPKAFGKERIKDIAEKTAKATNRLNRLVDDMLDITRIRTGKISIQKGETDLGMLVNDVLDRMNPEFTGAGCGKPTYEYKKVMGNWDSMRIEQVIGNLLNNALKYGNGHPVEVEIKMTKKNTVFAVKDHGPGISEADKAKIFERFERVNASKNRSGLGLGLYISEQIINLHGGRIWVDSKEGEGSSFCFELPLSSS
jgi:PAS domain S-box-containing protein